MMLLVPGVTVLIGGEEGAGSELHWYILARRALWGGIGIFENESDRAVLYSLGGAAGTDARERV